MSGILAYVFATIGTRHYGTHDFAPVSVLWSLWAASAAAITFPLQHWIIRSLSYYRDEAEVRRALPAIVLAVAALASVSGVVAVIGREALFDSNALVYPLLVPCIAFGSALVGISRGGLSGRGHFRGTALSVLVENGLRVAAGVVVIALDAGVPAFGAALLVGFAVGFGWPRMLVFARASHDGASREPLGDVLGGLVGASFLAQLILVAGPIAVSLLGGTSGEVTSLFTALALFRAPYIVATVVSTRLTGTLTRWVVERREGLLRSVRRGVLGASALSAAGAALLAAAVGEPVLRAIFGSDVEISRGALAAVGAGGLVALGVLVALILLTARGASRAASVALLVGVAVGAAWSVAGLDDDVVERVAVAFLLAEATSLALALYADARRARELVTS